MARLRWALISSLLAAVPVAACGSSDARRHLAAEDAGAAGDAQQVVAGAPASMTDGAGAPNEAGAGGQGPLSEGGTGGRGNVEEPATAGAGGADEPDPLLDVSAAADPGGTIEVTGAGCVAGVCSVHAQDQVTLEATPEPSYRFVGWQGGPGCNGKTLNPLVLTVTQSTTCTAKFVRRFVVAGAVSGAPAGVVVSASAPAANPATCDAASCEVDNGAQVVLSAPLAPGFYVGSWSGDGCPVSGSQITVPADADRVCTANYVPGLAVAGSVTGRSGSVTASSESAGAACASNQCAVTPGSSVVLTRPSDDPRGRWLGWFGSDGCTGTNDSVTLANVAAAASCEARFNPRVLATAVPSGPSLALLVDSDDPNDICDSTGCYADVNSNFTFQAPTDVLGWEWSAWSGDCDDMNATTTLTGVQNDVSCVANYEQLLLISGEPSDQAATITASADPGSCQGAGCLVRSGVQVVFHVNGEWQITGATGEGCSLQSDEGNPIAVADAEFDGQTCQITVAPATDISLTSVGAGTVAFSDEGALTCFGENTSFARCYGAVTAPVTIVATPEAGVDFAGWSGANCPVDGSLNDSETFTPSGGAFACTATFEGDPMVTINATVQEGGAIMFLSPPECEFQYYTCTAPAGSSFSIYINLDDGYLLNGWQNDDQRCQQMYDSGYISSESFDCYLYAYYQGGQ